VVTARKEQALTLPASALRTLDGKPSVLVLEDGLAQRYPVELGLRTPQRVEIVAGLRPGMRVIVDPRVAPGQKVRARPGPAGTVG
jgi:hypothetical protein